MAYSNCNCSEAPPLTSRSARAYRTYHANTMPAVLILDHSTRPRYWMAVTMSLTSNRRARFNSVNLVNYHMATGSLTKPLSGAGVEFPEGDPIPPSIATSMVHEYDKSLRATVDSLLPGGSRAVSPTVPTISDPLVLEKPGSYWPRAKKTAPISSFSPVAPNPNSHWYESERDARLLRDFVNLRLSGYTTNLIIVGPSGFGKTGGILRFGKDNNIPVHVVNCQAITTPEKWVGQMQVSPERGTYFDISSHVQWVERTHEDCASAEYCIILYDEITRLPPALANMAFSLLDEQQGLEVPQMNRRITMNPKNVVIATANIGTAYAGTFTMDWALRGRFDVNLERTFPPQPEEVEVLVSATGVSEADAASIVRVAEHTRTLWTQGELETPISTRSLVSWARFISGGYTIKDAAEYTIIPLYSEDGGAESDRAKVKLAVDGKVGA